MRYIAGRLLHGLFLLAGVSMLSFAFADLAPGDYYSALKADPRVSPQTVDQLRIRYGLDRPLPVKYAMWVRSLIHGDFGYSLTYDGPVAPLLWPRIRATLLLTGTATLLAWLVAIPFGLWNAAQRGTWRDTVLRFFIAFLLTIPDLLIAILLLLVAVETGWFPAGGMESSGDSSVRDIAWHLVLPVLVLTLGLTPVLVRHVRASIVETLDSPFSISAQAHGIPRWRLLYRHLLPAAVHPLISLFGLSLGTLLSASLLIEVVMGWPGLGPLFLDAILARDFAIVLAVILLSTTFLVLGNLAADLLLYRLDPRIRVR
jgi:peptide/nickel transport system permease protein